MSACPRRFDPRLNRNYSNCLDTTSFWCESTASERCQKRQYHFVPDSLKSLTWYRCQDIVKGVRCRSRISMLDFIFITVHWRFHKIGKAKPIKFHVVCGLNDNVRFARSVENVSLFVQFINFFELSSFLISKRNERRGSRLSIILTT